LNQISYLLFNDSKNKKERINKLQNALEQIKSWDNNKSFQDILKHFNVELYHNEQETIKHLHNLYETNNNSVTDIWLHFKGFYQWFKNQKLIKVTWKDDINKVKDLWYTLIGLEFKGLCQTGKITSKNVIQRYKSKPFRPYIDLQKVGTPMIVKANLFRLSLAQNRIFTIYVKSNGDQKANDIIAGKDLCNIVHDRIVLRVVCALLFDTQVSSSIIDEFITVTECSLVGLHTHSDDDFKSVNNEDDTLSDLSNMNCDTDDSGLITTYDSDSEYDNSDDNRCKLMLFGIGGTGKSTIYNQLQILYGDDQDLNPKTLVCGYIRRFSNCNIQDHITLKVMKYYDIPYFGSKQKIIVQQIRKYVLRQIATLILYCSRLYKLNPVTFYQCNLELLEETNPQILKDIRIILTIYNNERLFNRVGDGYEFLGSKILPIFQLECIQATYKLRALYNIGDNVVSFMYNAEYIFDKYYTPIIYDIVRISDKTVELISTELEVPVIDADNDDHDHVYNIELWDCGGERNQRMKYITESNGLNALIYVVALTDYYKMLSEDQSVNAMHESINEFYNTINKKCFSKTPVILLFTKSDLFKESLRNGINLDLCFVFNEDWSFPNKQWNIKYNYDPTKYHFDTYKDKMYFSKCYRRGFEFIKNVYLSKNMYNNRMIHVEVVSSINMNDVNRVFTHVCNNILSNNN